VIDSSLALEHHYAMEPLEALAQLEGRRDDQASLERVMTLRCLARKHEAAAEAGRLLSENPNEVGAKHLDLVTRAEAGTLGMRQAAVQVRALAEDLEPMQALRIRMSAADLEARGSRHGSAPHKEAIEARLAAAQELLFTHPNELGFLQVAATSLVDLGRREEARQAIDEMLEQGLPPCAAMHAAVGNVAHRTKRRVLAKREYLESQRLRGRKPRWPIQWLIWRSKWVSLAGLAVWLLSLSTRSPWLLAASLIIILSPIAAIASRCTDRSRVRILAAGAALSLYFFVVFGAYTHLFNL
jgi:hypothetical protein